MVMQTRSLARRLARGLAGAVPALGTLRGKVTAVSGLRVEVAGLGHHLVVGDRASLLSREGCPILAEIVGVSGDTVQMLGFAPLDGLGRGSVAEIQLLGAAVRQTGLPVSDGWIGRIVNPLGAPLDGLGAVPSGPRRDLRAEPPPATLRARLGPRLDLGVRVLDTFATCRDGQRLGLFAGSGVGKSTLLAMLARHTACDVVVLALVGERGREVREFIEDDLGPDGLARAVVVVATSDTPPLMRREAAYAAMTIAEHFRDQGRSVLLLMDSVTRFCFALREIGLSAGEPPATRGYPPSVFAELPRLLERAGPGLEPSTPDRGAGQITGLFTVLVEGDDHNEPVADAVRGILDGHIILDRQIAERGRYPAVDVLRSLSRVVPGCNTPEENALTRRARALLAMGAEMAELVRLGAYQPGSDKAVDEAIRVAPRIEAFLRQERDERTSRVDSFALLRRALDERDA